MKKFYAHKFDNLEEMDQILGKKVQKTPLQTNISH